MKRINEELAERFMETIKKMKKMNFHNKCRCELTPGQIGMLHLIYHSEYDQEKGISVRQISEYSRQTASAVTQAVNVLEKNKFVTRNIDKDDRRIIRVKLTPAGIKLVEEHHRKLMELSYDVIEAIGVKKITTFIDILNEILDYRERIDTNNG